jgi:hypothetical protein
MQSKGRAPDPAQIHSKLQNPLKSSTFHSFFTEETHTKQLKQITREVKHALGRGKKNEFQHPTSC